jgi:hypothetical protein
MGKFMLFKWPLLAKSRAATHVAIDWRRFLATKTILGKQHSNVISVRAVSKVVHYFFATNGLNT